MGRPIKNEETKRADFLKIRLTESEREKLKILYHKTPYLSLSAFVRAKIFDSRFFSFYKPESPQKLSVLKLQNERLENIRKEMAKIGSNINQIAKQVNSQKMAYRQQIEVVQKELQKIHSLLSTVNDHNSQQN